MARAHIEWEDGTESTLEEYESYLINSSQEKVKWGSEENMQYRRDLNKRYGYPDKDGVAL